MIPFLTRALGRIADGLEAYLSTHWVSRGYFSDAPTAMRFLQQFDPRHGDARLRDIFRLLRARRSEAP